MKERSRLSLEHLPWLPRATNDFRERCNALARSDSGDVGRALYALSMQHLTQNQLTRLAALHDTLKCDGKKFESLTPFRLGVISNSTTELLTPGMVSSALRHGIDLECVSADFDQALQEALDPNSKINTSLVDGVLVALDHRGLRFNTSSDAPKSDGVTQSLEYIKQLRDGIQNAGGVPCIFQTLAMPVETVFGNYERRINNTIGTQITNFNHALLDWLDGGPDFLLDVSALSNNVGSEHWFDPIIWHVAKLPFAQRFTPLYADHVARILGAIRGKSRKCLVMDLDNTLWGGVIGDDGLDGITVGQGDSTGEAYLAVQQMALSLHDRGVILAVCSKNDEANARLPFEKHPDMLLKLEHFAVFTANWTDKATNLEDIAQRLNIGLDAIVLLDDNPVERAQVRDALPMVAVPELPEDPSYYPRTLLSAGYFEAINFTDEDRSRASLYQAVGERKNLQKSSRNLDGFLRSLEMSASFAPFDELGRKRITQLVNKTNQFNLTTRRYSEAQIKSIEGDKNIFSLQVRHSDKFSNNGMVSVVICRRVGDSWIIDTWLMSCRVLNCRLEELVCNEIFEHAKTRGIKRIEGHYIRTDRNRIVQDHYKALGFQLLKETDSTVYWEIGVENYTPHSPPVFRMDDE